MDTLLLMLAGAMKQDEIIEKLQETIDEYKQDPCKETTNHVAAVCALFLAHLKTGGTMEGAIEAAKDFKKFDEREKLFNPNKN